MMTINLEKLLIKENKKLSTPKELLIIKEYEKNEGLADNDALNRVGIDSNIIEGKKLKKNLDKNLQETTKFEKSRVFHISQIQSLCEKYYLRFLPVSRFKGSVDPELATKITNFEATYMVKCNTDNTKICAPMNSFELEERPKDPLFFFQINEEYWYLIYKWGNDLNIINRFKGLLSKPSILISIIFIMVNIILFIINVAFNVAYVEDYTKYWFGIILISALGTLVIMLWGQDVFFRGSSSLHDWQSETK